MIIKNISPYPKRINDLGKYLMPGEQCDLSEFTQKQRDDSHALQEAFRKGEFICIGMGTQSPDARLRAARARILANGPAQPLLPVLGEDPDPRFEAPTHNRAEHVEMKETHYRQLHDERPQHPTTINRPTGMITKDALGIVSVTPVFTPPKEPESTRPAIEIEFPTITPERIREIQSQRCISFRTNGKKCKRWTIKGYEYCASHLPKKLLKEYKEKKKKNFFHE
jgi:hypothetical protein